ncbi:MAG: hypothetical protein RMJ98_14920 [Myxococcales bacterium]|nr:hypothetical protein [Myxococcales bacterium]
MARLSLGDPLTLPSPGARLASPHVRRSENDFLFRKIFTQPTELMAALLSDLLASPDF